MISLRFTYSRTFDPRDLCSYVNVNFALTRAQKQLSLHVACEARRFADDRSENWEEKKKKRELGAKTSKSEKK